MHIVRWIVGATVFLALLFLSLQNSDPAELKFFNIASFKAPLVVVVFIAFALGRCDRPAGGRAARRARLKRQVKALRREQRATHGSVDRHAGSARARNHARVGPGLRPRRPCRATAV